MSIYDILEHARCRPEDWHHYVSDQPRSQRRAKLTCQACPVKQACLEHFYLDQDVVVGGTTWEERLAAICAGDVPDTVDATLRAAFSRPLGYPIGGLNNVLPHTLTSLLHDRYKGGTK